MRADLYDELYAQERTHWWHVGKRERIGRLLACYANGVAGTRRALDVGCGTGGFLDALARRGHAVGMDHEGAALAYCRARGLRALVQHNVAQCPWPIRDQAFDVVTALDVVEHVDDDQAVVGEIHRVLKRGGTAVVSVPALQWLWSYWDEWLGHRRRYTRGQLVRLMQAAGFQVVWSGYAEWATLLAIAPIRWWKQRQVARGRPVASDNAPPPGWANRLLLRYERLENACVPWARWPWGSSVAAVGRRN